MKAEYDLRITAFIENAPGMPLATQQFKSSGTKTQVLKDLKEVLDKVYPGRMGGGSVCVTIKDKN